MKHWVGFFLFVLPLLGLSAQTSPLASVASDGLRGPVRTHVTWVGSQKQDATHYDREGYVQARERFEEGQLVELDTVAWTADHRSSLTTLRDASGALLGTTEESYDDQGHPLLTQDRGAEGSLERLLTRVWTADGLLTRYTWQAFDFEAASFSSRWEYDHGLPVLYEQSDATGRVVLAETSTYDSADRLVFKSQQARGTTTEVTFSYAAGRLGETVTRAEGAVLERTLLFYVGDLVQRQEYRTADDRLDWAVEYTYDASGRVVLEEHRFANGSPTRRLVRAWDSFGNLTDQGEQFINLQGQVVPSTEPPLHHEFTYWTDFP